MKTSKISLFYSLTQTEIIPPASIEIERKDQWIKAIQKTVEADFKPLIIKVVYELFNPEIENQRKFFEGAVIPYYAIQNSDLQEGLPDTETLRKYREEVLDETLGYDYRAVSKVIRKRKSTADFKSVQAWSNFLNIVEETIFESAGYEFPDSEHFWDLTKKHGYDEAKAIAIQQLQSRKNLNKKRYYENYQ